jgi:hypothetical protein
MEHLELKILVIKQEKEFYAICINFNIAETGSTFSEAIDKVIELSKFHIETVIKEKLTPSLLDRTASKEYWDLWEKAQIDSLVKLGQQKGILKAKQTQEVECNFSKSMNYGSKKLALQRN